MFSQTLLRFLRRNFALISKDEFLRNWNLGDFDEIKNSLPELVRYV
jgi:hypothetical protein